MSCEVTAGEAPCGPAVRTWMVTESAFTERIWPFTTLRFAAAPAVPFAPPNAPRPPAAAVALASGPVVEVV